MSDVLKHGERIAVIETVTDGLGKALEKKVDRHEFDPIRKVVMGLVAIILTGFAAALVKMVWLSNKLPAIGLVP
jgi:hypothetical protein